MKREEFLNLPFVKELIKRRRIDPEQTITSTNGNKFRFGEEVDSDILFGSSLFSNRESNNLCFIDKENIWLFNQNISVNAHSAAFDSTQESQHCHWIDDLDLNRIYYSTPKIDIKESNFDSLF